MSCTRRPVTPRDSCTRSTGVIYIYIYNTTIIVFREAVTPLNLTPISDAYMRFVLYVRARVILAVAV